MRVCAARFPPQEGLDGGRRVFCWLHTPDEHGPVDREPLEREELPVAEEA